MNKYHLDFETYSECDLLTHGAWVYSRHPSTRVLWLGWAKNNGEVMRSRHTPGIREVVKKLLKSGDELHAFYSFFECCIIKNVLGLKIDFNQWHDTMALACASNWPQSLGMISAQMKLPGVEQSKDKSGYALIRKLCVPQKHTKGPRKGELEDPVTYWGDEYWPLMEELGAYCVQDVIAERHKSNHLRPLSKTERQVWILNQQQNWRGMKVDVKLCKTAYQMYTGVKEQQLTKMRFLTQLANPNSNTQLLSWFHANLQKLPNMQGDTLLKAAQECKFPMVKQVMELKIACASTMPKKYLNMLAWADRKDHRLRGMEIYQAAGTGRTASRGINTANLPRPTFQTYGEPLKLVKQGDVELIDMVYGNPIDVLCSLIRTALTASKGHRLIAPDYSSIEPRVLHWLAGGKDVLREIRKGDEEGDSSRIYKIAASGVFQKPVKHIEKGTNEYQGGKAVTLACGYAGGFMALNTMSTNLKIDIQVPDGFVLPARLHSTLDWHNEQRKKAKKRKLDTTEQYQMYVVDQYRQSNPHLANKRGDHGPLGLWEVCDRAAIRAIENPGRAIQAGKYVVFKAGKYKGVNYLWIKLPSGRMLHYVNPHIRPGNFGKEVRYFGMDSKTRQWGVLKSYGGKWVENIVQAVARDIMVAAQLRLRGTVYKKTVLTVYDEIVSDVKKGKGSAEEMSKLLCVKEKWMKGIPLIASASELGRFWK